MSNIQKVIAFVAFIILMFVAGFYFGSGKNAPQTEPAADLPVRAEHAAPDMARQLQAIVSGDTTEAATAATVNALYSFVMATASTEGVNYQVSKAFADALNTLGYETAVVATGSSFENIAALKDDKAQLAILTSDRAVQGYNGTGVYNKMGPAEDLRVLMSLWPSYLQIVTLASSNIKTVHDLAGKKVALDESGSDSDRAFRSLFAANNVNIDDALIAYPGKVKSWEGLKDGTYDVLFVMAEIRSEDMVNAQASETVFRLIPVDNEVYEATISQAAHYMQGVISADVYGLDHDTPTIMVMNVMVADADVPGDTIYEMLTDFFADFETFKADSGILTDHFQAANPAMDIGVPLHDGTLRYFRENGMVD